MTDTISNASNSYTANSVTDMDYILKNIPYIKSPDLEHQQKLMMLGGDNGVFFKSLTDNESSHTHINGEENLLYNNSITIGDFQYCVDGLLLSHKKETISFESVSFLDDSVDINTASNHLQDLNRHKLTALHKDMFNWVMSYIEVQKVTIKKEYKNVINPLLLKDHGITTISKDAVMYELVSGDVLFVNPLVKTLHIGSLVDNNINEVSYFGDLYNDTDNHLDILHSSNARFKISDSFNNHINCHFSDNSNSIIFLELYIDTFLSSYNPYKAINSQMFNTDIDSLDDVDGSSLDKILPAYFKDGYNYHSPKELYNDTTEFKYVMTESGIAKECVSSGIPYINTSLKNIKELRQRYPIYKLYEEGSYHYIKLGHLRNDLNQYLGYVASNKIKKQADVYSYTK